MPKLFRPGLFMRVLKGKGRYSFHDADIDGIRKRLKIETNQATADFSRIKDKAKGTKLFIKCGIQMCFPAQC